MLYQLSYASENSVLAEGRILPIRLPSYQTSRDVLGRTADPHQVEIDALERPRTELNFRVVFAFLGWSSSDLSPQVPKKMRGGAPSTTGALPGTLPPEPFVQLANYLWPTSWKEM